MQNDREKFKKEFIQRLISHSIKLIRIGDELKKEKISYHVIEQLIDSGTSIGANVVEAKSSHSKRDYVKFFEIALKSANETKYWLIVIKEITMNNKKEIDNVLKETVEIANILASSILTLKGRK